MNNSKIERIAVYEAALAFTKFGWSFREQPILDIGIDAIVETPINEKKKVNIFALQIKGGESNFYKTKKHLTFYLSNRHYEYWAAISEIYPVLIILYDPATKEIYWNHFDKSKVRIASKKWKIEIPKENILNQLSKTKIESILQYSKFYLPTPKIESNKTRYDQYAIRFSYFISDEKNKELHLVIINNRNIGVINLRHTPLKGNWDKINQDLTMDDPFYFALKDFETYIQDRCRYIRNLRRSTAFNLLLSEISKLTEGGIKKIAEFIFDNNNKNSGIPAYKNFLLAFEHYSKLKPREYQAQTIGKSIIFKTEQEEFEIETRKSLSATILEYIDERYYSEIYLNTDEWIWNEIFISLDIAKHEFVPKMLNVWEDYWASIYRKIKNELGPTNRLGEHKEKSLRKLEKLFDLYDETKNIIQLAYNFDELELFPLAVISMVILSDPESCLDEYCDIEFSKSEIWTDIVINEEDENSEDPIFYIKTRDI